MKSVFWSDLDNTQFRKNDGNMGWYKFCLFIDVMHFVMVDLLLLYVLQIYNIYSLL